MSVNKDNSPQKSKETQTLNNQINQQTAIKHFSYANIINALPKVSGQEKSAQAHQRNLASESIEL